MMLDTQNTGFMAFGKSANNINFEKLYDYAQNGGDALAAIQAAQQLQNLQALHCMVMVMGPNGAYSPC